ncbi:hypothetical protein FB451DRAFT_1172058 [Mycena latifolia]|nr:hypothetical protein FB451DRAFT_1172058 [Mycena latifolia]
MSPRPWATEAQGQFLQGWMGDFISRQGEGKLHLFWAPMFEAWFSRWPEHQNLGLPLPNDRPGRALTQEELAGLGAAIVTQQGRLENWFRNQRKKIGNASAPAGGASSVAMRSLFRQFAPKRRRAHQATEVFQMRNTEALREVLEKAGYKDEGLTRADRMRIRTRVVNTLWAAATEEEVAAVEAEVQREKEEIREAEQRELDAAVPKKQTPRELQDGIDVLDKVYTEVHTATYNAAGWVGMSIMGGPNPRMGGELSMKIICFGQTPAGNDFEESCVDFDKNLVEPFGAYLRACYTAQERAERALPARPAAADGPGVGREDGAPNSDSAATTTKRKRTKKKKKAAKAAGTAGGGRQTVGAETSPSCAGAESGTTDPWLAEPSAPPEDADDGRDDEGFFDDILSSKSVPDVDNDAFSSDTEPPAALATPPPTFNPWPPGMALPPSPTTAMAIADAEHGVLNAATLALDLMLMENPPSSPPPPNSRIGERVAITAPMAPVVARPKPRPSYRGASHALSGGLDPATPLATTKVGGFNFPLSTPSSGGNFEKPSILFGAFGRNVTAAAAAPTLFPLPATPRKSQGPPPGFTSKTAHAMAAIIGVAPHVFTGQIGGEATEQAWAQQNGIPPPTRQMGEDQRRDFLDKSWAEWDFRKNGTSPAIVGTSAAPTLPPPPPPPPVVATSAITTPATVAGNVDPVPAPKPKAAPVLPGSRPHIKPPVAKAPVKAKVPVKAKSGAAAAGKKAVSGEAKKKELVAAAVKAAEAKEGMAKRGRGRPRKATPVQEGEEGEQSDRESGEGGEVATPAAVGTDAPPLADASNTGRPTRTRKATRFVDGSAATLPVKSKRGAKKGDAVPEEALAGGKRKRADENVALNAKRRRT